MALICCFYPGKEVYSLYEEFSKGKYSPLERDFSNNFYGSKKK